MVGEMAKKLHNVLSPFLLGKKILRKPCSGEMGNFLLAGEGKGRGRVMIKTWGRVFLAAISKNEQI